MNFLDEIRTDWDRQVEFYNSPSAELMRSELERQVETMRAVVTPIQNLHPKKTERINWQKEGF